MAMAGIFSNDGSYGKLLRQNKRLTRDLLKIESVFNAINTAVMVVDACGEIQFANNFAKKILGLADGESRTVFKILPGIEEAVSIVAENGAHVFREFEINYPETRILGAQIVPYLPGGQGGGTFALILNDITQDRRDTEDLIENEKIASVLDLASGVAHELGNPLNSINIHLQLARRKLAKLMEGHADRQSVSDVMESVEICSQEVSRLDGIIENFLKALRPMRPNMSECDMLKPLMETLHILKAELEDLEIEVNVVKESGMLPKVFADENLLKQLYFNILRNAMEAMDGGGSITVDAREEDDCVRVSFTDTGCGMDEDGMSNLFRPHYTTKPDGNGLGMTIIHAIVRAHNGKIDIDSRPGEGTTVSVCIPRAEKRVKMLEHDDDSE